LSQENEMRTLLLLGVMVFLSGCAVQKELSAMGGSRADGTVEMAFSYGLFEVPKIDWNKGTVDARQVCAGWGYSGAQPFGSVNKKCQQWDRQLGCVRWLVSALYQCTN
jgi:hypothetical protein